MDKFNFHDIRIEKANAILTYRRVQRLTTLFRFVEFFIFLIILSSFSSQFAFSFNLSIDCFSGIFETLSSQRFVFLIGNAIIVALFLISGRFNSADDDGEKGADFYDDYVEQCRKIEQIRIKDEKIGSRSDEKKIRRSRSENFERPAVRVEECRRGLRRSMTEKYRKNVEGVKKTAAVGRSVYVDEEMSNEDFRRTVEAFIARQQRCLKEEEEEEVFSADMLVSV